MSEVKDTQTQATKPAVVERTVSPTYSQDDQYQVKLIAGMLDEAGNTVGRAKSPKASDELDAYGKLHNAFRNLFKLRGQPFLDAFGEFIKAINKYPNGIYYTGLVNKHLDEFNDRNERETFMVFINMAVRFARCADKQGFAAGNNVERLCARVVDPELQAVIRHAFLAG